jgi:RNA polymerase sigma-70 factor (ECF subfamily)
MSDEALVAACATGEKAALGALYDRHATGVRRFLSRLSGTDERDLDDLVQTTFEAVPRASRGYDARSTVRTWLIGIANNTARHHVRTEIRRRRLVEAARTQPVARSADPAGELLERERAARLRDAIDALSPKLREAFVMIYLEGLSGIEAARLLDVREGAIWKRLHEARAFIRERLEGSQS